MGQECCLLKVLGVRFWFQAEPLSFAIQRENLAEKSMGWGEGVADVKITIKCFAKGCYKLVRAKLKPLSVITGAWRIVTEQEQSTEHL